MFTETKTKKEEMLSYGKSTMDTTRDGLSSMLTKLPRKQPRDTAKIGVCISTDCSTSDLDSQ
jgi:hypothetical protein